MQKVFKNKSFLHTSNLELTGLPLCQWQLHKIDSSQQYDKALTSVLKLGLLFAIKVINV